MWLLAVVFFTGVAWGPLVWGSTPQAQMLDRWVVIPQVQLLLFLSPALMEDWPGPIKGTPLEEHRLLLGIVYGMAGWFLGWLIFRLHTWWPTRIAWVLVGWLIWVASLQVLALVLQHFGIL